MNVLRRIFGYNPDPDTLESYRTVIPDRLKFHYETDKDGKYIISVTEIDEKPLDKKVLLVSEADTKDEILSTVHDLVMSYLNVPEDLRPYYERVLRLEGQLGKESAVLVKAV